MLMRSSSHLRRFFLQICTQTIDIRCACDRCPAVIDMLAMHLHTLHLTPVCPRALFHSSHNDILVGTGLPGEV